MQLPPPEKVIQALGLAPLEQEGGYFASTYRSSGEADRRHAASAIYYLLMGNAFSHLHCLDADEIYHFYLGDPVELLELLPDGRSRVTTLGPDLLRGQRVQAVVTAGTWQGSRLLRPDPGRYALLGTTMSPGFSQSGYRHGDADALQKAYPREAIRIKALCGPTRFGTE